MVRGFDTNFDIIDNAFINILMGGFSIDFNFINNVFVSISAAPTVRSKKARGGVDSLIKTSTRIT
jgi:hypothetical protein